MPDDTQRLVVSLEARLNKYEKDMARAGKATNDNFKRMEGRAKQFADNTEKALGKSFGNMAERIEGAFAPFLRGGVVFAGVAGAAMAVKEIADSIAEVDREARKAGVSSKTWQQWQYVATATGASVDGVTDALKELNIRADEFAKTGKGSGAEWFARLGYTADEVGKKLADPNRFLDEIIGKLQKLNQSEQTRALDELFGGTGAEQLAKVLGMSVEEIQRLRNEAATFTDEQIEAAKKIDREWDTMWRNFTVYAKQAAIEGVGVAQKIFKTLNGEYLPGYQKMKDAEAYYQSDEFKLKQAQKQREQLLKDIANVEADPALSGDGMGTLDALKKELEAVETEIVNLGGGSDRLKQALKELSDITQQAGGTFNNSAAQAANFKAALADLKNLVPELKAELDELGKLDAIDAAFKKAVGSATTMSQVMGAVDIANRAKTMARFGKHDNILDLIAAVESGGSYNATLDNGRWTGGAQNLTAMTLDQILALGDRMRTPENRALYGDGKGSSALGRYQITGATLRSLMDELGLTGDRLFNEDTQDELARALLRRRGNDPAALRNEWEGLRRVDDGTIRDAYNGTPTAAQKLAPTDAQQKQIDLAKQQTAARKNLNATIQEGLDKAKFEQQISGMSESQKRVQLQLWEYQAQAKRAGITLTDEEIQKMREKLTLTDQLDQKNRQAAQSQNALQQAGMFFGQQFTSSLSGLLTGTSTVTDAVRNLANALIDASLQAMLLGQGPLAALFGTAGGGGLFGAIFGFADGGYTGQGGKYEPAGVVHRGEYVMSKKATDRIGVGNLEALHRGALAGFDRGGYVGSAPAVRRAHMPANSNAPVAQPIQINSTVNVNANGGDPAQNADLAAKVSKQVEQSMRGMIGDEVRRQSRPGAFLNTRSR
ncbi:phage tail tape measure protein [Mesorhizobium sp. M00.F.Ca.ET.151.01.1.1]|nr:phage tail tape measure protein [Mesorhizobium sp. M00.F.Ca.ET.151.01.1.1]